MTARSLQPQCPLCDSPTLRALDQVAGASINAAYKRSYGIEAGVLEPTLDYMACDRCGLRFFTPPADGDAQLYEQLQRYDWYYSSSKPEYGMAVRHLPAQGPVLEVGSGKAAFADLVGRERYSGLEFNDAAVARAAQRGVMLVKESIEDHARSHPAHYAAVVSFQVLEHVRSPARFLAGCVQALAPGGRLILAVPDHDGLCGMAQNNILDMPPHHVSHWNERSLRHIAELFGLRTEAIEHEPVAAEHLVWAQRSLVEKRWRKRFGLRPRVLDTRWGSRLLGHAAALQARWSTPDVGDLAGHTVLACLHKP